MKNIKVCIGADTLVNRKLFIDILSRINNIEIVGHSSNGKETEKMIFKLHPDIALLSINMPDMNGIDVLTRIKDIYPDIKFIIFSRNSMFGIEEECLKRGADHFFQSGSNNSLFDLLRCMKQILN
ncbi:response regulator transcription factor [Candidatus Latescibacterota bacterium]